MTNNSDYSKLRERCIEYAMKLGVPPDEVITYAYQFFDFILFANQDDPKKMEKYKDKYFLNHREKKLFSGFRYLITDD